MTSDSGTLPRFEPLDRKHNRAAFSCHYPEFSTYLQHTALQQAKKKLCVVNVLLVDDPVRIAGYHTLSAAALRLGDLPSALAREFPKYEEGIPATLVGRLAVDDAYRGKGWGEKLLMDALARSLSAATAVGSAFVIVRAIDRNAIEFYSRYGFIPYPSDARRLFLPMKTLTTLLK
jgi:Acetyltransferases